MRARVCSSARLASALSLTAAVVQDYQEPEQAVAEHQCVRDDEDPVRDEPAIDREAERRGYLADEEPLRNALARTLLPLLVDLLRDGQHENPGADPADRFRPHPVPLVVNFPGVTSQPAAPASSLRTLSRRESGSSGFGSKASAP